MKIGDTRTTSDVKFEFIANCNADLIARKMVNGQHTVIDYDRSQKEIDKSDTCQKTLALYSEKRTDQYGECRITRN